MGFVRFALDRRSTSTSFTTDETKKYQCQSSSKDGDVDDVDESDRTFDMSSSDRTYDMSIEEIYADDASSQSSLDGNQHPISQPQDVNARARVSFRDEELGLNPCHIVTNYYWRPRTTNEEKSLLYYNPQDFAKFKREEMYIQHMIRMRQRMKENMTVMSRQEEEGHAVVNNVRFDDFLDESMRPSRSSKCSTVSIGTRGSSTDSIDIRNVHEIENVHEITDDVVKYS